MGKFINWLKSLFKKDLAKITSSFLKIQIDLDNLMSRLTDTIKRHDTIIANSEEARYIADKERHDAARVKANIEALLGK